MYGGRSSSHIRLARMDSLVKMATTVGSVGRRGVAFSTTGRARRLRSVAASMLSGGRT